MVTAETHILKSKFGCIKSMDLLYIIEILVKVIAENNDQSRITIKPQILGAP